MIGNNRDEKRASMLASRIRDYKALGI
jgi:hypothetical protein